MPYGLLAGPKQHGLRSQRAGPPKPVTSDRGRDGWAAAEVQYSRPGDSDASVSCSPSMTASAPQAIALASRRSRPCRRPRYVDVATTGLVEVVAPGGGRVDVAVAIGTPIPSTASVGRGRGLPYPTITPAAPVQQYVDVASGVPLDQYVLLVPRLTVAPPSASSPAPAQYATALLMPLLVLMATMMVTSAVSSGVDWLYPVRVVTTSVTLWSCRQVYRPITWTWSGHAMVLGMVVFGVWIVLEPAAPHRSADVAASLATLPSGLAVVWVGCRVLGSVLIVPLAEELAFRGYVLHKLIAHDFASVRPGQFTWGHASCRLSSLVYCMAGGWPGPSPGLAMRWPSGSAGSSQTRSRRT